VKGLTCDGGEFEEVPVQVDVHPGAVVGQRDAAAVPPHREVLVEAEGHGAQPHLHGLRPGEGARAPGVVLHQHLLDRNGVNLSSDALAERGVDL